MSIEKQYPVLFCPDYPVMEGIPYANTKGVYEGGLFVLDILEKYLCGADEEAGSFTSATKLNSNPKDKRIYLSYADGALTKSIKAGVIIRVGRERDKKYYKVLSHDESTRRIVITSVVINDCEPYDAASLPQTNNSGDEKIYLRYMGWKKLAYVKDKYLVAKPNHKSTNCILFRVLDATVNEVDDYYDKRTAKVKLTGLSFNPADASYNGKYLICYMLRRYDDNISIRENIEKYKLKYNEQFTNNDNFSKKQYGLNYYTANSGNAGVTNGSNTKLSWSLYGDDKAFFFFLGGFTSSYVECGFTDTNVEDVETFYLYTSSFQETSYMVRFDTNNDFVNSNNGTIEATNVGDLNTTGYYKGYSKRDDINNELIVLEKKGAYSGFLTYHNTICSCVYIENKNLYNNRIILFRDSPYYVFMYEVKNRSFYHLLAVPLDKSFRS